MATTATGGNPVGWPSRLTKARLHFVSGKGGTGKSTVAAALALTLAAGGRKVLLVEVEERQGIAQLFDVPPLPYKELKIATADGGGVVNALAIDIEAAFMEYLDMFYNLGIAGRAMRRIGAIEFATTIAPGLRDVLLTGKIKESVVRQGPNKKPMYDAVVVDSPPTGRIARFLDVTNALADLAKGGPVHSQSEGVVRLLHSEETAIQPIDATIQSNLREITTRVLASLTPREERIVRMRFGLGMNSDHTLEEVGQQFSVTRERIRQIEAKAIRKLKHPSRSRMLRSFLDN